ncbi:MAG: caspase family protein, partial [Magnetococcales bacterium]|nr:caspase family protein [Magnetococcales bacterium]
PSPTAAPPSPTAAPPSPTAAPPSPTTASRLLGEALPIRSGGIDYGRYHALVVGIDRYRILEPLTTAVGDARALAELLSRRYGFQVRQLENPDRAALLAALESYRTTLEPKDNLVIYFAGHGRLESGTGECHWLPADAARDPGEGANGIANSSLVGILRGVRARHVLVVADSCFAGQGTRPPADSAARQQAVVRKARVVLGSGGRAPVVAAGGQGSSVFSGALLRILRDNDGVLTGKELAARLQPLLAGSGQGPDSGDIRRAGHDGGDFHFVAR